jgi:FkbM family methyltransferase
MSLPPEWHGHPKLLYAFGWHQATELPILATSLSHGEVVLDIGANVGLWSLILSKAVGANGKVFAFEPTQITYNTLTENVALNSLTNVVTLPYALSNHNGQVRLYHDVDASRNSFGETRLTNVASAYEEVSTRTLDSLIAELHLEALDFVKIDVEGAEPLVFEGARNTLARFRPTILFEVSPKALAALGFRCESPLEILSDLSYRFYELDSGKLTEIKRCPTEKITNLWAIHSSRDDASRYRDPQVQPVPAFA